MKTAPAWRIDQARRLSSYIGCCLTRVHLRLCAISHIHCQFRILPMPHCIGIGCRREQQLRIGMLRMLDHLFCWSSLDHLTGVHHQRLLREIAGAGDIVCDVEKRQSILILEARQQIQHVQANGYIEHRNRLVSQDD